MKIRASSSLVRCTIKKGNTLVLSFFILQAMQLTRYNYYTNKLGFVGIKLTLFCGRYLELAETIQPSLCKGIPLLREMSRRDKGFAVFARKASRL